MSPWRRAPLAVALVLAGFGACHLASAAWIHGKALVAQQLIAHAWRVAQGAEAARPWPGADLRPVARLSVPSRGVALHVLDTSAPRALAFGPGHMAGTAAPGAAGNSVIVAHRDTHFAFLRALAPGEAIEVEAAGGARVRYRVENIAIVHQSDPTPVESHDDARLTLITCFPFDAVRPGTPWRYVVTAQRVA